jgi:hypothetical protein
MWSRAEIGNISGSSASVVTGDTFTNTDYIAFLFQTGSSSTQITSISLPFWSNAQSGTSNFTIELWSVASGSPSSVLASASVSGASNAGSPAAVNAYTAGQLGTIATTSLLPNTAYAVVLKNSTTLNFNWGSNFTNSYTTTDGWLYLSSQRSSNSGSSWNQAFDYSIAITTPQAPSAPAAVPTLSEWAQLMLALMVISMLGWQSRKQQN